MLHYGIERKELAYKHSDSPRIVLKHSLSLLNNYLKTKTASFTKISSTEFTKLDINLKKI